MKINLYIFLLILSVTQELPAQERIIKITCDEIMSVKLLRIDSYFVINESEVFPNNSEKAAVEAAKYYFFNIEYSIEDSVLNIKGELRQINDSTKYFEHLVIYVGRIVDDSLICNKYFDDFKNSSFDISVKLKESDELIFTFGGESTIFAADIFDISKIIRIKKELLFK
ncbi:MAG: hypothetical protein EHM58_07410 [Ignavibacteriae bacterium]|nr:MAG: hypothetical protein EHM58_07410 [Ignavibacteriota bacterium]